MEITKEEYLQAVKIVNAYEKSELKPSISNDMVEYIELLCMGTKAYYDKKINRFVSNNRRFNISLESALSRSDMYIHYKTS